MPNLNYADQFNEIWPKTENFDLLIKAKKRFDLWNIYRSKRAESLGPEKLYPSMEEATNAGLAYGRHIIDNFPDKLPKMIEF